MSSSGTQYGSRIVATGKVAATGLLTNTLETVTGAPADSCRFVVSTGTTAIPDVSATAGIYTILPASQVPTGMKCYITKLEVYIGATLWGGGTAGTVSLTIEDTAGTNIATYTQTSLAATTYIGLPANGTLPTGVTDILVKPLAASTAVNTGIQALVANSTTGTAARIRVEGYFAP